MYWYYLEKTDIVHSWNWRVNFDFREVHVQKKMHLILLCHPSGKIFVLRENHPKQNNQAGPSPSNQSRCHMKVTINFISWNQGLMDFAHKIEQPGILMLLGITQETKGELRMLKIMLCWSYYVPTNTKCQTATELFPPVPTK